ncbi:MAG: PEP-CTERM sorting domain-containing protein [Methylotenera sp.]|nr:PEP-CTERM sorting domain-containing protein [Methylotenera sp.]
MFYIGNVLDREFYFSVSANNIDDIISPFDLSTPGTYSGLEYRERGYLRLNDPLDPGMFSQDDCPQCAVAIGTMIAVPEPEAYALLLAGLGMISWRVKWKSKPTIKRISVKNSLSN